MKKERGIVVTCENFFEEFADLAGIRILTLYRWGFEPVHKFISENKWWDVLGIPDSYAVYPEDKQRFTEIGLKPQDRTDQPYTSIHYTVVPHGQGSPRCEIQVRGLHLEGWGEVDHQLRYPDKNPGKLACDLLALLHQAAAVTDWLAHLAGKAAEIESRQAVEKEEFLATLSRLTGEIEALRGEAASSAKDKKRLERTKAAAEGTVADLRRQLARSTSYPGLGVPTGAQGLYSGVLGGTFTLGDTCGLCGVSLPISINPTRVCPTCGRTFGEECAAVPKGALAVSLDATGRVTLGSGDTVTGPGFDRAHQCKQCATPSA